MKTHSFPLIRPAIKPLFLGGVRGPGGGGCLTIAIFFSIPCGFMGPLSGWFGNYRVVKGPRGGGSLIFPKFPNVPQSSRPESLGFPSYPLPLDTPPPRGILLGKGKSTCYVYQIPRLPIKTQLGSLFHLIEVQ